MITACVDCKTKYKINSEKIKPQEFFSFKCVKCNTVNGHIKNINYIPPESPETKNDSKKKTRTKTPKAGRFEIACPHCDTHYNIGADRKKYSSFICNSCNQEFGLHSSENHSNEDNTNFSDMPPGRPANRAVIDFNALSTVTDMHPLNRPSTENTDIYAKENLKKDVSDLKNFIASPVAAEAPDAFKNTVDDENPTHEPIAVGDTGVFKENESILSGTDAIIKKSLEDATTHMTAPIHTTDVSSPSVADAIPENAQNNFFVKASPADSTSKKESPVPDHPISSTVSEPDTPEDIERQFKDLICFKDFHDSNTGEYVAGSVPSERKQRFFLNPDPVTDTFFFNKVQDTILKKNNIIGNRFMLDDFDSKKNQYNPLQVKNTPASTGSNRSFLSEYNKTMVKDKNLTVIKRGRTQRFYFLIVLILIFLALIVYNYLLI